ncbi:unnamed protein product [Microthlaspi erraticum]|uniref:Uncharacterized protein n=1 Tax=Microthlaspi erraticum TaxID=1685480 RepID=A0A6D2HY98_9BRAS|nr:unnamed protein product [Microthlaspi erraticum]
MGHKEHGGTWHMEAAQLDTQRKKGEAILKTSSTVYSTNRSSSSTRPAKLQLDRAGSQSQTRKMCMRTRSSRSTEDLVELDITTGRKRVQRSQRVQEEPEVLVADTMDVPEGNGNPLGMDSVELGKLDRLVKEMLQTATNRDKGLFHHQCRTTTLRSSWE